MGFNFEDEIPIRREDCSAPDFKSLILKIFI
jgi:hypothetical protein